jgi:hypothetical protein
MEKQRAQEIKNFITPLTHRMSSREANQLFDIYKREINPKAPKTQPCTCNGNIWKEMLAETHNFVEDIINPKDFSVNIEVVEETQEEDQEFQPLPTVKKRKKS